MRKKVDSKTIETTLQKIEKPTPFTGKPWPLNDLGDREFEILLYQLFKKRIENGEFKNRFDSIDLMQGVGERGRDCQLYQVGKSVGLIQCKKVKRNLNKPEVAREIIKFALNYLVDKTLIHNIQNFTYYFTVSTGFAEPASLLLSDFKNRIKQEKKLKEWTEQIIGKYKKLGHLNYESIQTELMDILSSLKTEKIIPEDIELLLNSNPEIQHGFFEIRSVVDNKPVKQQTDVIKKGLNQILHVLKPDEEKAINDFLKKYKKAAVTRLNTINFLGLDLKRYRKRPRELEIEDLYIAPQFRLITKRKKADCEAPVPPYEQEDHKESNITVPELFSTLQAEENLVVLGDPGAGKSLLVKYCLVKLLQGEGKELGLRELIPFRIELRKYNQEKQKQNITILNYLKHLIHQEYQIETSDSLLNKIFESKKTIFFFDGLDEIFDLHAKSETQKDIETFAATRPHTKVIITSRFIGYQHTTASSANFLEVAIQEFDSKQIETFVKKFYSSQIANPTIRKEEVESFLQQSKAIDQELIKNPLTLSLITILAINHLEIPESKLEIYESCTKTLVDTRDRKEKELNDNPLIHESSHKRRTFGKLAYWQYEAQSEKKEVTYEKAIAVLAEYLNEKEEFEDSEEAKDAAENFLEYAERRSIYFENNFTHKTFLEYYTADFIYIRYHSKGKYRERDEIITRYLSNPFWSVVFELLIAKIDKEQEDNEVLDDLITTQLDNQPEPNREIYSFFLQCLRKAKNIGKKVKGRILKESILFSLKNDWGRFSIKSGNISGAMIDKIMSAAYYSKNLKPLLEEVFSQLKQQTKDEDEKIKLYTFVLELPKLPRSNREADVFQLSKDKEFQELLLKDPHLFFLFHHRRLILKGKEISLPLLKTEIQHFGLDSLFYEHGYHFDSTFFTSLNGFYFFGNPVMDSMKKFEKWFFMIKETIEDVELFPECLIDKLGHCQEFSRKMFEASKLYFQSNNQEMDQFLTAIIENHKDGYSYFEKGEEELKCEYLDSLNEIIEEYQDHPKFNDYMRFAKLEEEV